MTEPDVFRDYPATLKQSTLHPEVVYRRADDLIAVRGPRTGSARAVPVLTVTGDDGEPIAVYRVGPAQRAERIADSPQTTAVYVSATTRIAVPTGRVFIRFRDTVLVSKRTEEVSHAGYRTVETLPYAPSAAWLEAADGQVASALGNIGRLEALSDVVNVEPQLLAPRVVR